MKRLLLLLLPLSGIFTGCAGLKHAMIDMTGAGAGAAVGHFASRGNPAWTAGGAAIGVGAAEAAQYYMARGEGKAFGTGYDKGRSDAVKEQYWIQQNFQQTRSAAPAAPITLYPIPIPEQEIDGVKLQPTTRVLRIQQ